MYTKKDILEKKISFKPITSEQCERLCNHFGKKLEWHKGAHYRFYDDGYSDCGCMGASYLHSHGLMQSTLEISYEEFDFEELPEKWCIKCTRQTHKEILPWFKEKLGRIPEDADKDSYWHYPEVEPSLCTSHEVKKGYTEITFKQFKKYVLEVSEYNIPLTRFNEIIEVACSSWKDKLTKYAKENITLSTGEVKVSQDFLDQMLKAATTHNGVNQKEVIQKVFGLEEDPFAELKKAYSEGKTIQFLSSYNKWEDCAGRPLWSDEDKYRIKPEPKYVPFAWEDRDQLRGKWFVKQDGFERQITSFCLDMGKLFINNTPSKTFLDQYKFLDGTPCGKLVEE